jgi:hypothetical protein
MNKLDVLLSTVSVWNIVIEAETEEELQFTAIYLHERFSYDRLSLSSEFRRLRAGYDMCQIEFIRSRPLLIGSVYRPPNVTDLSSTFIIYLQSLTLESSEMYLLGDFSRL